MTTHIGTCDDDKHDEFPSPSTNLNLIRNTTPDQWRKEEVRARSSPSLCKATTLDSLSPEDSLEEHFRCLESTEDNSPTITKSLI